MSPSATIKNVPTATAADNSPPSQTPQPVPSTKLLLVVAVAFLDTQGRVLLAERPAGKSLAGLWEFPGGKVEMGETPEAALVRELHEELGVVIDIETCWPLSFASHTYTEQKFHLLMPLYGRLRGIFKLLCIVLIDYSIKKKITGLVLLPVPLSLSRSFLFFWQVVPVGQGTLLAKKDSVLSG